MAEPHARIVVSLPWHDKVVGIAERDRAAAFGIYCAAVCFCQLNRTDGIIRDADYVRVFPSKNSNRIAGVLVESGLFERCDNTFRIHDYLDHNKSKAQIEEEVTQKKTAGQKGGEASAKARAKAPAQAESNPLSLSLTKNKEQYSDEFDAFWDAYPEKKGGKWDAFVKYQKRIKDGATDASLLLAALNYCKERAAENDPQYTKRASSFLHQRCDEDYQKVVVADDTARFGKW